MWYLVTAEFREDIVWLQMAPRREVDPAPIHCWTIVEDGEPAENRRWVNILCQLRWCMYFAG